MSGVLTWMITLIILIVGAVVALAYFYSRATREVSLIRTGYGGLEVVLDGGVFAIPYFHAVSRVNMKTQRLEIRRAGEDALITNDRLRVDIAADFYLAVEASEHAIARASQTLGDNTFNADKLRELIEGKLVDALRTVAAKMTMDDLHEKRGEFVTQVAELLHEPLAHNGLVLDSVSLSGLDQTPFAALDENNAFNAVGMRKLAEVIARSKKERAEIDADAEVAVHRSKMEATQHKLNIDLEREQAEIKKTEALESLRAAQLAEIASRKADSEQSVNAARIRMEQEIRAADLAREQAIREAEIAQIKALEIAEQERVIAIANKTLDESKAKAEADKARAAAIDAHEAIESTRAIAEAERNKSVAIMQAQREAEIDATRIRVAAEAKKQAAQEEALATKETADAQAHASARMADSELKNLTVQAEGRAAMIAAENAIGEPASALQVELARIQALPQIAEKMAKPLENIGPIKIHQISGVNSGAADGSGHQDAVDRTMDSIMNMAVKLPMMKKIGEEVGIDFDTESLKEAARKASRQEPKGS